MSFQCTNCGCRFNTENELNIHIKKNQLSRTEFKCNKQTVFKCVNCEFVFLERKTLDEHKRKKIIKNEYTCIKKRDLTCNNCDQLFKTVNKLEKHKAINQCKKAVKYLYKCKECNAKFVQPESVVLHACNYCEKKIMKLTKNQAENYVIALLNEEQTDVIKIYTLEDRIKIEQEKLEAIDKEDIVIVNSNNVNSNNLNSNINSNNVVTTNNHFYIIEYDKNLVCHNPYDAVKIIKDHGEESLPELMRHRFVNNKYPQYHNVFFKDKDCFKFERMPNGSCKWTITSDPEGINKFFSDFMFGLAKYTNTEEFENVFYAYTSHNNYTKEEKIKLQKDVLSIRSNKMIINEEEKNKCKLILDIDKNEIENKKLINDHVKENSLNTIDNTLYGIYENQKTDSTSHKSRLAMLRGVSNKSNCKVLTIEDLNGNTEFNKYQQKEMGVDKIKKDVLDINKIKNSFTNKRNTIRYSADLIEKAKNKIIEEKIGKFERDLVIVLDDKEFEFNEVDKKTDIYNIDMI